ncbi:MAG: nitrate reductase maturation protein NarM [Leptolyngbyaceae cyanobacterium CSU_1_3]|nr:nitrate reductase maturation protein NarM [Leptolyngbyaceae cyanobacterium CSU_1_3]
MNDFFQFEADFVESLRCIPMQVRLKLDTCGVKLKLAQWNKLSQTDRQILVDSPCETNDEIEDYRSHLQRLILQRTGEVATDLPIDPQPDWTNEIVIPESVQAQVQALQLILTQPQWASLTPVQRFALIKLSRSNHENSNFLPAMQEFHLV